jgi:hypothetical protein
MARFRRATHIPARNDDVAWMVRMKRTMTRLGMVKRKVNKHKTQQKKAGTSPAFFKINIKPISVNRIPQPDLVPSELDMAHRPALVCAET